MSQRRCFAFIWRQVGLFCLSCNHICLDEGAIEAVRWFGRPPVGSPAAPPKCAYLSHTFSDSKDRGAEAVRLQVRPFFFSVATVLMLTGCEATGPAHELSHEWPAPLAARVAPSPPAADALAADAALVLQAVLDHYHLSGVNIDSIVRLSPLREDAVLKHGGKQLWFTDEPQPHSIELESIATQRRASLPQRPTTIAR